MGEEDPFFSSERDAFLKAELCVVSVSFFPCFPALSFPLLSFSLILVSLPLVLFLFWPFPASLSFSFLLFPLFSCFVASFPLPFVFPFHPFPFLVLRRGGASVKQNRQVFFKVFTFREWNPGRDGGALLTKTKNCQIDVAMIIL